jgi:hypothetical protein
VSIIEDATTAFSQAQRSHVLDEMAPFFGQRILAEEFVAKERTCPAMRLAPAVVTPYPKADTRDTRLLAA